MFIIVISLMNLALSNTSCLYQAKNTNNTDHEMSLILDSVQLRAGLHITNTSQSQTIPTKEMLLNSLMETLLPVYSSVFFDTTKQT